MTPQAAQTSRDPSADIGLAAYKGLFLEEAATFLTALRENLTRLVGDPDDGRALEEAHRAAHTLKGMASTMRYEGLAALAQRLESPFLPQLPLTREQIDCLLAGCDEFEAGLEQLKGEDEARRG